MDMLRLGAHVTISPTPLAAIEEAKRIGANTIQIFTHNPRGWQFKPLDKRQLDEFAAAAKREGISPIVSHCNYLINLGGEGEVREKSLWCLKEELKYAKAFGCKYFVLHVGKHKEKGMDEGIRLVVDGIHAVRKELADSEIILLLETVAGQGSEIGADFAILAKLIGQLDPDVRKSVGVCLDTCHVFVAGYDIRTKAGVSKTMAAIRDSFGLDRLKVIHVNDAKGELGGHLDRHAHIGDGSIGLGGLKEFLTSPEIRNIPMIIETPEDEQKGHKENLAALKTITTP